MANKLDIEGIEKYAAAATEGPWFTAPRTCVYKINDPEKLKLCIEHGFATTFEAMAVANSREDKTLILIPLDDSTRENAEFVARARADVPILCEVVRSLAEALKVIERAYPLSGERMAHQDYARDARNKWGL